MRQSRSLFAVIFAALLFISVPSHAETKAPPSAGLPQVSIREVEAPAKEAAEKPPVKKIQPAPAPPKKPAKPVVAKPAVAPKTNQGKAAAKKSAEKAPEKKVEKKEVALPAPPVKVPKAGSVGPTGRLTKYQRARRHYGYRMNNFLGALSAAGESSVAVGAQLGFAYGDKLPIYIGPEVSFSLFSPGSMTSILAGGWYEMRIAQAPRLSVAAGLVTGVGFTSGVTFASSATYIVLFDTVIAQEVDDLFSVRGQLRPGIIAGRFAFMMNLSIGFRFN